MTARKMASNLDANGKKILNLPVPTDGSTEPARKIDLETVYTAAISRANHTGTQLAATISDFNAAVRLNRLDQLAAPTTSVGLNGQKITGLGTPTLDTDAATKLYVDQALAGQTSGQHFKGEVRALVTTDVTLSGPGATLDGVTAASGDVFWLAGQSTATDRGPWVWNGAAAAMTRPTNFDSDGEAVVGSYWIITEGTESDSFLLLTNDTFDLGTDTPTYKVIDVAAAAAPAYTTTVGNGTAGPFTVTHNFNTRAVAVHVFRTASPYDEIDVAVERTTVNTVSIAPDETWAADQYTVVVGKL